MFYIVSISWWAASKSDDRVSVYLEKADSPKDAQEQAKRRLSFIADDEYSIEDHIFDSSVKSVSDQNIGLVYSEV